MAPNISNNASFAKNSSGNLAIQGNNIYNPVICSSNNELMKMLSNAKQYEAIQAIVKDFLSAAATAHPLQPHFTAKYSSELERLISAPETEEALKKYPKTVKGTYRIDYNQFPYMDRSETPWAYAYRTQTKVELETTSYKEYLGDQEDPFPVTTYSAGMITIIEPPPFPDAVEASISSGESSIPISFRRKPCMEYGQVVFGIESLCGNGINIDLVVYKDLKKIEFRLKRVFRGNVTNQLRYEKLISEIGNTGRVKISSGDELLIEGTVNESELTASIFSSAPVLVQYLENLSIVEAVLNCQFDLEDKDIDVSDYKIAHILAASLKDKWLYEKLTFDDEIRCDYNNIPEEILDTQAAHDRINYSRKDLLLHLQGKTFAIENYIAMYERVRINNISSVIKNHRRKRKGILITFRPTDGNDHFCKYHKFEGITVVE